jgi:hypothetical protein
MYDVRSHAYSRPGFNGVQRTRPPIIDYVADDQPILAEDVSAAEAQTTDQTLEELTRLVVTKDEMQSFPFSPHEVSSSRENRKLLD